MTTTASQNLRAWVAPSLRRKHWEDAISSSFPGTLELLARRPRVSCPLLLFVPQKEMARYRPEPDEAVLVVPCLAPDETLAKSAVQPWATPPFPLGAKQYEREVALKQALQAFKQFLASQAECTELARRRNELDILQSVGVLLTSEPHLETLLGLIVTKAREIMQADAGSLYLVVPKEEEEGTELYFVVAQNETLDVPFQAFRMPLSESSIAGFVALHGKPVRLDDVYRIPKDKPFSFNKSFDEAVGYRGKSMLTAPLMTHSGEVIGILQLINKKTNPGQPFDGPADIERNALVFSREDQDLAMALGSQAAIAVENARLYADIRHLLQSFMHASVKAIEARDPTTSGHSERVAEMTVALARTVDGIGSGKLRRIHFGRQELEEIYYAGILHDFGKIGVREDVLTKAKKLYPAEFAAIRDRYQYLRRILELQTANRKIALLMHDAKSAEGEEYRILEEQLKRETLRLDRAYRIVHEANEPAVLPQEQAKELHELLGVSVADMDGSPIPLLTEDEFSNLRIPKGSLNDQERLEIESHVSHTYQFLKMIPWTKDLGGVPEIAFGHHEKLDGSGYPRGLTSEQIPVQVRMMTIADIFDALTAQDRPYKKALPVERALNILHMEKDEGKLDADLVDLFTEAKPFEEVLDKA